MPKGISLRCYFWHIGKDGRKGVFKEKETKEGKIMRRMRIGILLLGLLLVAGCMKAPTWTVTVNNYTTKSQVESQYSTYTPDPGYTWLVLDVSVHNNSRQEKTLNEFLNTFQVVTANSYVYEWQLLFNSIVGQLPTFYPPKETRTGELYFHVPVSTVASTSKLVLKPFDESAIVIELKNVPAK